MPETQACPGQPSKELQGCSTRLLSPCHGAEPVKAPITLFSRSTNSSGRVNCQLSHTTAPPHTSNHSPHSAAAPRAVPPPFLITVIPPGQLARGDSIWSLDEVLVTQKISHQQKHTWEQNLNSAGFGAELRPSVAHLYIISTITIHSSFPTREHGCRHFNNTRSSTLTDLHSQSP